jgi:undecaprenyl-diphosphatase
VGETFFDRPTAALLSGVALVGVVVLIGVVLPSGPLGIDQTWSEWMRDAQTHALHQVALAFNWLGRGIGRALSLAAIGLALAIARRWWALAAFAAAESLTPLASNLTKHLVARPRPEQELLHVTGSSFPSGHAAYAGATCVALVLLYARSSRHRRIWWAAAVLAIAGMAWSRTYLEVHWLTDVIAGALLGVGVALLTFAGAQMVRAAYGNGAPAGVSPAAAPPPAPGSAHGGPRAG